MHPWKDQRRTRALRIWILAITAVVYAALVAAVLWFGRDDIGPGDAPWFLGSAGVVGLFLGLGLWMTIRGSVETPPAYLNLRREREQWGRMHNCLYAVPLLSTVLASNDLNLAHNWMKGQDVAMTTVLILMFAAAPPVFLLAVIQGARKGEPGTPQRRMWERLNDELSLQHAGLAYRFGFCVALAALVAVLTAALFAPKTVVFVLLIGIWAATVATGVRFGLLQRAAEPPLDEA